MEEDDESVDRNTLKNKLHLPKYGIGFHRRNLDLIICLLVRRARFRVNECLIFRLVFSTFDTPFEMTKLDSQ